MASGAGSISARSRPDCGFCLHTQITDSGRVFFFTVVDSKSVAGSCETLQKKGPYSIKSALDFQHFYSKPVQTVQSSSYSYNEGLTICTAHISEVQTRRKELKAERKEAPRPMVGCEIRVGIPQIQWSLARLGPLLLPPYSALRGRYISLLAASADFRRTNLRPVQAIESDWSGHLYLHNQ